MAPTQPVQTTENNTRQGVRSRQVNSIERTIEHQQRRDVLITEGRQLMNEMMTTTAVNTQQVATIVVPAESREDTDMEVQMV